MDYKQKLNDLLLTIIITAILFIGSSFIFVNITGAAIVAQQLDDTAETNFNSEAGWYGSFTQKLSLNPNEFQGAFNKIELKLFSEDGGSWLHSLWIKEVDPDNPSNYSFPFYSGYVDFGAPNQWNTISYRVGDIITKSDKIYELGVKGRWGYGLKLKGSVNQDSYPYGDAYYEYGSSVLGNVKDLYFKVYSVPTVSELQQLKSDGTTPINEGAVLTEPTIIFKARLNDLENDSVKLQVELRKTDEPFNENDLSGLIESSFVPAGSTVMLQKFNPSSGKYKWRARVIDSIGDTSEWWEFGYPGITDFEVVDIPFISNLGQYKSDKVTLISEGGSTRELAVVFKANLIDPDNHQVKLQVELRQINQPFTGIDDGGILNSDFISSDSEAMITRLGLIERKYHWRARAIDSQGNTANWQHFGTAGNVDFLIGNWSAFTDVSQNDFSHISPRVSNLTQILGNGLSETATNIQLRGFSTVWWSPYLQFAVLECDSNPLVSFGCAHITETFVVRPDSNGFINQPLNITLNPDKYYAILFYQDWFIGGSTSVDSYPNGSILSWGYNVGELKQAYFYLKGAKLAIPSLNQPPIISNIHQFKSDGITLIQEGETTAENTVVFKTTVNDPDNDQIKLQIEIKEFNQPFDETNLIESDFVNSGSEATIIRYGLISASYHWRARAVDSQGNASDWQEFGTAGNEDFIVELPLATKAATLAKELVNQSYLWGGKGWDYYQDLFVPTNVIKTGYNFYNASIKSVDIGAGMDCSGLVMWSYNRSFNPLKSRFNNFVKAEGADEQFRENTEPTTETELQPGDAMFFDWGKWHEDTQTWDGIKDNYIDHVAMYVGESDGFDVVSAADPERGIVPVSKNDLKKLLGFVTFKRVVSAVPPSLLVSAGSPVDLNVTDPDGFTITPTTIIPSDLEFLRQIPGVLYYFEMERGADGNPIDQVYSYTLKTGDYTIQVLPEPGIPSDATYTLDFSAGEQSITLAQDVPINQIPSKGYGITTSDTGVLNTFIPVSIDIKPGSDPNSINLKSNGVTPVSIFGSATFDVNEINLDTIKFADAAIKLKNNGQLMAGYKDLNRDGITDLIIHFATKELNLSPSDTHASLEGKLFNGTIIKSLDLVRIIP